MKCETDCILSDEEALTFAAGCLRAAVRERLEDEIRRRNVQISAGLVCGLVFFAHGTVEGSGAWPLLWPLIGGFATILRAGMGRPFGLGLRLGWEVGAVTAVLFFLFGVIYVAVFAQVALKARLYVIALGAALGLASTLLGDAAASLVRRG